MNFCKKPFEQLYIGEKYVKTCPWTNLILGNPLEEPIEELWMNEKAEEVRESIRDGSFRFCRKEECPWCASGMLEEIDDEVGKNYVAEPVPININVSYDRFCNHSCPSCRTGIFHPNEEYKERMKKMKEIVLPLANKTQYLSTCGMGDCFSSPFIMEFLQELRPEHPDFHMSFETNGVMLDEKHWEAISNLHQFPINFTITPNSFDKYTYRYLSGGHDNVDRSKANLKFVSELRKAGKITSFKINMVVQESNYWEIPSFIEYCLKEYDPDIIQIKPLNRWFCLDSSGYWFKNILNPLHPYHENYLAVMRHPILQHPKVWDWTIENHDRSPKMHPAVYYATYVDLFWELLQKDNVTEYLSECMKKYNVNKLAIYGAWKYGEMSYDLLKKVDGIEITYFVDKYKGGRDLKCKCLPVRGLWGEDFSDVDTILITVMSLYEEIVKDLRDGGYQGNIISINDLM